MLNRVKLGLLLGILISCSGTDAPPTEPPPPGVPFELAAITAGQHHTCGLTSEGNAFCWGENSGQLGDGTTVTDRSTPVAVQGGHRFVSLAGGYQHTCGLTSTGSLYCWGYNGSGQLGDGTQMSRLAPTEVLGGGVWTDIDAGDDHTCALRNGGAIYCWGGIAFAGDDGSPRPLGPRLVDFGRIFTNVISGTFHACARTVAEAWYCWGSTNASGVLGPGTSAEATTWPVLVHGGFPFTQLAAGVGHGCGLASSGEAYCWGSNRYGQLGTADTEAYSRPTMEAVTGGLYFALLVSGYDHACGLTVEGVAYCWGANGMGELGDGSTTTRYQPTPVQGGLLFKTLTAGIYHTCGITRSGVAYCWGGNQSGEVGDGTNIRRLTPVPVIRR